MLPCATFVQQLRPRHEEVSSQQRLFNVCTAQNIFTSPSLLSLVPRCREDCNRWPYSTHVARRPILLVSGFSAVSVLPASPWIPIPSTLEGESVLDTIPRPCTRQYSVRYYAAVERCILDGTVSRISTVHMRLKLNAGRRAWCLHVSGQT